ncbi:hypothetical protein R7127_23465 [Vibrio sp. 1159]|uniref:hypothetical protein n=1 Tax=Vibrio sp. 1159 TaxID=3074545 RepID=UPI002965714E|nr:hypothetical protein [Vibrio sp. 1159]MDW2323229.1 hypothetical protein [Vibrio sp. 1159]
MKKLFVPAMAALTLALSGCASNKAIDPTPLQLNTSDSVAMQSLKSGFDYVPFDIKDAVVAQDVYDNKIGYGTSAGLGFLAHGGIGALGGLGMAAIINAGGNVQADFIQIIAWIPADNIDITNKAALDDYLKTNYLKPAADTFIASDFNKQMEHPTEFVSYKDGSYRVKGGACWPVMLGDAKYGECNLFPKYSVDVVRYATEQSGIPFNPDIKADRYIIVRLTDGLLNTATFLPFIKTNMVSAYVPAMGYKAEHLNRFSPSDKPLVSQDTPFVIRKGNPNFFVKVKN